MSWRSALLAVLLLAGSATLVFYLFQRQLASAPLALGTGPEIRRQMEDSLEDLKALARLDPARETEIRRRFDEREQTVRRLQVLEHSRRDLARRYRSILLALIAVSVALAGIAWALRQGRQEKRLAMIRDGLVDLGGGRTDLELGVEGRDTVGRIAAMIEETSRAIGRDRRRLAALKNLSAWQEAARRHAHEMRTPLTGARLEVTRLLDLLAASPSAVSAPRQAAQSALQELDRLGEFTRRFTSFARLPLPQRRRCDLGALVKEFVHTFGGAWPNLRLRLDEPAGPLPVVVDRDMLRQVLVNLCDNSSQALDSREGDGEGSVTLSLGHREGSFLTLDVADDGPGVAQEIRSRLFEPYATTRTVGEGMGLGLAISKKILLDHGGDLELWVSGPEGTTFRLTLPGAG